MASQLSSGVSQIFSTGSAFAALKADGSVVTWGYGGGADSRGVASQLSSGVSQIFSTGSAFAALKVDGSVVTWGGEGGDSSGVASQLHLGVVGFANPFTNDRLVRFSPPISLAVSPTQVTEDGAAKLIYTFTRTGDTTSSLTVNYSIAGSADASDYTGATPGIGKTITFAAGSAIATLAIDPIADSIVEWDETVALTLEPGLGYTVNTTTAVIGSIINDDSLVAPRVISSPIRPASPGRTSGEWRNGAAFAALKADGYVVTWGAPLAGGDSSAVATQLSSGVSQIFSSSAAFAALKANGSVVTWGYGTYGGDSSAVATQLSSGVSQIFSTRSAFAALKTDGSVVTWGVSGDGGDSSAVASQLSSSVRQIFSSEYAFAALKADGSVVTWGNSFGGDSSAVASQLRSGVSQIFSSYGFFAAL